MSEYYDYEESMDDEIDELTYYCVLPVIEQVTAVFLKLFGLSAIISIFAQLNSVRINSIVDICLGLICAFLFYESSIRYIVAVVSISYLVVSVTRGSGYCGALVLISNLLFVFTCELVIVEAEQWHQIRGTIILLLMKTTSLGFDMDAGVISIPPALVYFGYTLSPISLIFGPFVTLSDYKRSKNTQFTRETLYGISSSLCLAYSTVIFSTCILNYALDGSHKNTIFGVYFTAQSFRASHYFVCYTSQITALIGGYQHSAEEPYTVVSPLQVEIPASMSAVAKSWNLPMHYWLKTYIYKKSRSLGMFVAGFLTYAASSILHGLNFQLPVVLFSIFLFSYVEIALRNELATLLDTCVRVHRCHNCSHKNKILRGPIKLLFIAINVIQLAYLGVMFDSDPSQTEGYSWWNVVSKWSSLYWYGHVLCGAGAVFTALLHLVNRITKKQQ